MPSVVCHTHPQAHAHVAALLGGTVWSVSAASGDTPDDPAALLLTAYQPSARERRPHAGIHRLAQWRREGENAPALVCAFRSKQSLLRFPTNIILQEPGTSFLHLPCGRDALRSSLEAARPLSESERDGVVQRASTVWGQLSEYLAQLIDTARKEQGHVPDLAPLHSFVGRHFGDRLGNTLDRAETHWHEGEATQAVRLLREAQERVPEAAVYQAFGTLAHGRSADLSNKGVGPLRAALISMQQGLAGDEHLETVLDAENWSHFKSALQDATRTLTLLQRSPYSLPDDLRELVYTFLERVDRLLSMIQTGRIQKEPATAVEAIDDLQDASRSILRRRPDDAD